MTNRYNTNLASEFWVLSALYRRGIEAYLTLGNKKSVDILIRRKTHGIYTIDVKGLAGRDSYWPADNVSIDNDPTHFYIFLSFEGNISNPLVSPSVWIIPSDHISSFIKHFTTRKDVSRKLLIENGHKFKDGWQQLSN
ncbi:MAG TPA: hypothetical protein VMW64_09620 [Dehalococcoidia bacterium]|nr:hypothetical protein [Dehalococcoidia bacterium]